MYVARKSTQAPPPRRFLRTTCSNVYPPGVAAVADTVSSQDSHVSVKHNMSRSWSTTKSAKKARCCRQISHSADTTWQAARLWSALGFVYYCPGKKVALGQSWRTGRYYYWYLAWLIGTRTTAPMGGSVECHPCDARCSPGSIIQTGVSAGA